MFFFISLDVNIKFTRKKLIKKSYITVKVLPKTKKSEFINKKNCDNNIEYKCYNNCSAQ